MNAQTCIQKLRYVCSTSMGTVDVHGNPRVRIINIMHVEPEKGEIYFVTARGKNFYRELQNGKEVAITALTRYQEMIRVNGIPERVPDARQKKWLDRIFEENQVMNNVYPGKSRYILEVFCVKNAVIEYFNLGVHPIFRESYAIGKATPKNSGFTVTGACIGCGKCMAVCPQGCILGGKPVEIKAQNCLHCGLCSEVCPVKAIKRTGEDIDNADRSM